MPAVEVLEGGGSFSDAAKAANEGAQLMSELEDAMVFVWLNEGAQLLLIWNDIMC